MVRYRKPVERSENIIDLRGLTNEQARAVLAARERRRKQSQREVAMQGFRRPQGYKTEI